jgi:hypothetical protein
MIYNANVSHAQPQLNLRYIFYIDHHMCSYLVRNTQLLEHLIDIFLREIWKRKKKEMEFLFQKLRFTLNPNQF